MASQPPPGGFSLFPNTSRPPSRQQNHRPRAATPQHGEPSSTTETSPPRNGRETPIGRALSKREGKMPAPAGYQPQTNMDGRVSVDREDPVVQRPPPVADVLGRSETAFSEAPTLVRGASIQSRSSIAKRPFPETESFSTPEEPTALRSIFPRYNPDLPPDRQEYYPTQTSPTHIPRAVISRPLYSPTEAETRTPPVRPQQARSPPMSGGSSRNWPPRAQEAPVIPPASTTEELRGLWKVANGWKAPTSEGRVYCLKMTQEKDTPVYNLSSASQPFYNMHLNPTSMSAYMTLSRHDPVKTFKGFPFATGTEKSEGKNWQEAIATQLEEESRKHPPNDGLVALLYPTAAAKLALDKPDDMASVMTAERECARLVWDEDSGAHFLVHPALAMPFCVTIERNQAWSRTEYTLEHLESPQHIARLTRDGTGTGWLEIDTAIAAKIDSVYIVDVAVAALVLVAHGDDKYARVETFEPPPMVLGGDGDGFGAGGSREGSFAERRSSHRLSNALRGSGGGAGGGTVKDKKSGRKKRSRMEEFELDIESQTSELGGKMPDSLKVKDKDTEKLPGTARGIIKLLSVTFKCFIWVATMLFRALAAIVTGLAKCLTSEKL